MDSIPKTVRVLRHLYDVTIEDHKVVLTPRTGGDRVEAGISGDDYRYTHGGRVYRAASNKADELQERLESGADY